MKATSASSRWGQFTLSTLISRIERYAALTIPKVCLPNGITIENTEQSHDYQSIGAQAVNHVVNKLMLALFAPSRPFIKLDAGKKIATQAASAQITTGELNDVLAEAERNAVRELDKRAQRPKLYQVLRHLVVAGNVLLVLGKESMRVMGIKYFRIKRDIEGNMTELVIREEVEFDELEAKVQLLLAAQYQPDTKVEFYRWIKRAPEGHFTMTQWVNDAVLPEEYNGKWSAEDCPYLVLTWDLADEANYGTGLVEEYIGDLEAISVLAEGVVDGAVLGCEMRWMVNPSGITSVEDMKSSNNGDYIPGLPADVAATSGLNSPAIETASNIADKYEKRIARGFLMGSAMVRDAERVTQEEIRLTANELETAYGGVYSTLAASLQLPVARWLFKAVGMPLKGDDFKVTIVTGLDALSRNGDLENFRMAMGDLATIEATPPSLQEKLNYDEIVSFIGQGRGIALNKFIKPAAVVQQEREASAQARAQEAASTAAGQETAKAAAQQQIPQG